MHLPIKVFGGTSNPELVKKICARLSIPEGKIAHHVFPSGEHFCQFSDNIRGCDVFLVQSVCCPAHERLMELLVMLDAAKRASAGRITVVCPYLGYLRGDRKVKSRTPITGKLVANLITAAGADRILGVDFHCEQAAAFFDIPVDHLYGMPVFLEYCQNKLMLSERDLVVVAPDAGGIKRANAFSKILQAPFAFVAKKRTGDKTVESQGLVGDVKDCDALIVDDMSESCGTLIESAKVCKQNGAKTVQALVTHGLLTDESVQRLREDGSLDKLVIMNTVASNIGDFNKIEVLDISPLLARAIRCINQDESVSQLFSVEGF